MGQCCANNAGAAEDETPQEFEDIREKTQTDLERDIASRNAKKGPQGSKPPDRLSRYAAASTPGAGPEAPEEGGPAEPTPTHAPAAGLVEHSAEGFSLSAAPPAAPEAPPEAERPPPETQEAGAAEQPPPSLQETREEKDLSAPPPQAAAKDNESNQEAEAARPGSDTDIREKLQAAQGKRSNVVETRVRMTAREREKKEEEEREEADRRRKEDMLKQGEVKRAALVDWKDDDFEINDAEVEIHMDGQDAILEITSNLSEGIGSPNKTTPVDASLDKSGAAESSDVVTEAHPYPSAAYFSTAGVQPPQVTYYHARNMLTISLQPHAEHLSFTPPNILHYKADEHEAHLPLLHDGCTSPKVASAPVHLRVASSDDDVKKSAQGSLGKDFAALVGCAEGEEAGVEQIIETSVRRCNCVVRFLGPSGDLSPECIRRILDLQRQLKEKVAAADEGKLEVGGHVFTLGGGNTDDWVAVRLQKPTADRWAALIQPEHGLEGTARRMSSAPAWISPEDVDSDDDDDDDDDDNDYT